MNFGLIKHLIFYIITVFDFILFLPFPMLMSPGKNITSSIRPIVLLPKVSLIFFLSSFSCFWFIYTHIIFCQIRYSHILTFFVNIRMTFWRCGTSVEKKYFQTARHVLYKLRKTIIRTCTGEVIKSILEAFFWTRKRAILLPK